ncbi:MAG: pyridoxamine 5'-phosphate oxidase [Actinomycetota bacterium]|nr:pyridoxamine 5'-phosphate oxidase [Actinomycetota bacterium]
MELRRRDLDEDPLRQFAAWFAEAWAAGVRVPEAVALATATREGAPSLRMVLVKRFDERGFVFHTNYDSRKGRELAANPRAALLFHWDVLGRQVRIEGTVRRTSRSESEAYFRTRPYGGRVGAWASPQSRPIFGREELEAAVAEIEVRLADEVPLPPHWGGYVVRPRVYEFWQHRDDRLHDRFRYRRGRGGWTIERLAP